jgi:hypothetical protein
LLHKDAAGMGMKNANFRAIPGASGLVNVAATSAAAALPGPTPGDVEMTYRITNDGPAALHFMFGTNATTVAADGTAVFMRAGNTETFDAPRGATHIATIGDGGGTARLFITRGEGS